MSLEGVEPHWARRVVSILSCDLLSRLDGENWSPLLLVLRAAYLQSDVVVPGPWDLITVELASICEVDLFANYLQLCPLLGPFPF